MQTLHRCAEPFAMLISLSRMLKLKEAAAYCGLPMSRFRALCSVRPVRFEDSIERWDIRDLDNWLDGFKSGPADDVEAILARLG